jgi:hypothetical protein
VLGNILDHGILAQGLNYADTVQLVHFSSCLMMDPQIHDGPATRLKALGRFPISGYSTSVNWANSAIIEFMYLNLMLEYRLIPSEAAKELLRLMPFAGNTPAPESICDAAGFQIWEL